MWWADESPKRTSCLGDIAPSPREKCLISHVCGFIHAETTRLEHTSHFTSLLREYTILQEHLCEMPQTGCGRRIGAVCGRE